MTFELFMNFNGNARAAMEFYASVFKSQVENAMTFAQAPSDPNFPIPAGEEDRIMYASVKIGDKNIMFMDMGGEYSVTMGDNITPVIRIADRAEIDRIFALLADGGKSIMTPQKVWFSEYYSMVVDKFGITWHIMLPEAQ